MYASLRATLLLHFMSIAANVRGPNKNVDTLKKTKNAMYEVLYNQLNDQQKLAVETVEGPVMVVAGPGTGKTQVIALRVANILRKTQMQPRNILCLTFSKSGAIAMRKRLRTIIGSEAYGVTVDTIHGFCNSVIQQFPQVFEEWSALQQISDVERYRELNKIIDQLMPNLQIVSKKNPYTRTKDILQRISQLKREGVVQPENLQGIVDEYTDILSTKSKEGTKVHARNLQTAVKFGEFVQIFHAYQHMLEKTGRYDFDDMILRVTQVLKEEDWLLAGLQERYQYVLIDEFQDTNGAQYECIEQLTKDPTGDNNPNFFVVGDDDQAIYRFQGANLTNILSFRERFPAAPVIALTTSYRCTQPILDTAEKLITHNTERLVGRIPGLEKHLTSARSQTGIQPQLLLAASDTTEPWLVAEQIEKRIQSGTDPQQIAVLVQTNAELLHFYDVLQAKNIPVEIHGKIDLLAQNVVKQALCILRAIHEPSTTALLSAAMGADCFGCHPADLSALYQACRTEKCNLLDVLLTVDQKAVCELRYPEKVLYARDTLLNLHHQLPTRTVVDTLEHALKDTGLLSVQHESLDIIEYAILQQFFDRVKQRAYEQPAFSYDMFLSDIDFYDNDDYGELRLTLDVPHLVENGVQLMTAHKSKGLEFEVVFLANFREGHWDSRRNPPSLSIPEDLLFGWEKDQKAYEQQQDERRVVFVAMTRAKNELIFTCSQERTSGDSLKAVSPSAFIAEADIPEAVCPVENTAEMSTLQAVVVRELDAEMKTFLRRRIENFALSATALHDFLEDPQLFLERHLLLVPQAKTIDFVYGNAVHHALASWATAVQGGQPPTLSELLQKYIQHLEQKELLPKNEFERLEALGTQVLTRYYAGALQPPYPIISKVESGVYAHFKDIPLKGKLDRIDLLDPNTSNALVLDYKTGTPKAPKQIEDYGYHRQLVFYALLLQHSNSLYKPQEFALEFVGHEEHEPKRRSYTIGASEKQELEKLIEAVWAKIIALDFTAL